MRRAFLAVALTVALAGCGASSGGGQLSSDAGASSPSEAASQPPIGPVAPGAGACAHAAPGRVTTTTDVSKKPVIEVPDATPPCNLALDDIVLGTGPSAKPGDKLTMKYVGVLYSTGKQFDASWDRGEDFPFTLGGGNVIQGWDQGLLGMRAGGRRQLIIPPSLGYGDQGAGADIPPGATLIFVVDLVKIG